MYERYELILVGRGIVHVYGIKQKGIKELIELNVSIDIINTLVKASAIFEVLDNSVLEDI